MEDRLPWKPPKSRAILVNKNISSDVKTNFKRLGLIAAIGMKTLEEKISNSVFLKRVTAGVMMLIAIGLFSMAKQA